MSEVTIAIPKSKLEDWIQQCAKGIDPEVIYSGDPEEMLRQAYRVREDILTSIAEEISSHITINEL